MERRERRQAGASALVGIRRVRDTGGGRRTQGQRNRAERTEERTPHHQPEGARNARFQARGLLALVREALGRGLIKESDAAAILQVDKKTLATLQADWFADPVTSIGQGKE
jgi:hypothetical protein